MANEQNLKPFTAMTESEQRAIASKGGKASALARSKQKTLKEMFLAAGDTLANSDIKQQLKALGYDVENLKVIDAILKVMCVKTFNSRTTLADLVKFVDAYAKYTGQEPAKEVNLGGELSSKIKYITPDSMEEIKKHIADTIKDV